MTKSKLLLVDDTDSNLDILIEILGGEYSISVATSGELALQIAPQIKPDLILLDIIMPGLDGYEVCRRLKMNNETMHIPIIFVTVKSSIEHEQKGLNLGAIDYIRKPFSPPIVLARVKNHLLIKHQRDQLEQSISLLQHEKELLQQKADLGILAGSLAHDLANIFCSASLLKYLPQAFPKNDSEWWDILENIKLSVENIDLGIEICRGFTNYLQNIGEEAQPHSLNEFLPVLGIHARRFKGRINQEIAETTPLVHCKSYHIKRVLINLFVNAIQALEDRPDPEISIRLWGNQKYSYFSIKDNGCGISQSNIDHVFDEFFTTKPSGTGIGLSQVKQIVDFHKGEIRVNSVEGMGTEFIIALPAATDLA